MKSRLPLLFALFALCSIPATCAIGEEENAPIAKAETSPEEPEAAAPESAPAEPRPERTWTAPRPSAAADGMTNIIVIPVKEAIGKTNLYILRRALKEAIADKAEVVILDMDTPGGRADIMLEMMEMVDRYEGRTIAYINKEAMSAGALISASADDIYFAPRSIIGAAAVVKGDGSDLEPTLKAKIDSYMDARLRALTDDHPRRADVLRAMMQTDYVLELDGVKIKDKGILLSLTDKEAMKLYGEPPTPLLGSGIYEKIEDLAKAEYGEGNYSIKVFRTSWSESGSMYMEKISPVLISIGILCLVVGFYIPGFGLPEITGLCLFAIVFLSNYMAGLAGHEPLIFFAIGFMCLLLELLLFPGVLVLGITGVLLMLGSLIWSLADVWPKSGGGLEFDLGNIASAFAQVSLGMLLALIGFAILYRFLPRSWVASRLVLQGAAGVTVSAAGLPADSAPALPPPGSIGRAVSNLRPAGSVEIDGQIYEASLLIGSAERGEQVLVKGSKAGILTVEKLAR